jgi:hypothetical protein
MESVEWANYGTESGNPKCANCMVHSGYEASGVNYTFGSMKGLLQTAKAIFFDKYEDAGAQDLLNKWQPEGHGPLVQIGAPAVVVTTSVNSNDSNMVAGD